MSDVMWANALILLARRTGPGPADIRPTAAGWEPAVDVFETSAGLVVVVALPGVKRDDMEVVIADGELMVRGTRHWLAFARPSRVHRVELPHGHFERRLPLPHGTYQLAATAHVDGCLHLTLRRLD